MQFWVFYRLFRRWRWVILTLGVCVTLAVAVTTLLQPPVYTAAAVIYPSQEASQEQTQSGTQLQQVRPIDRKVFLNSLVGLLRTRGVWEMAQQQGATVDYMTFQTTLGVQISPDSDLVHLSWKDNDAETAVTAVNAAADAFASFYEQLQSSDAAHTREVLEAQLVSAESELTATGEELRAYQGQSQLLDDKDIAALKVDYDRLVSQRRDVEAALRSAQSRASALAGQLAAIPERETAVESIRPTPELEALRQSKVAAEAQMAQLRAKYTSVHPKVIELQATIDRLAGQIAEQERTEPGGHETAPHPVHQSIQGELATTRAQADGLAGQLAQIDSQVAELSTHIAALPGQNFELSELTRKKQIAEATYQRLAQARDEARVSEETAKQKVRMRIVERAAMPLEPQPRQVLLKSLLALVATLFLSTVLILLLEQTDNRIKGPADVERLVSIRTLVSVPLLSAEDYKAHMLPEELELERVKVRAFNEAFRSLRSQLFVLPGEPPARAIAIASARSGEGRTTVAVNLAEAIAQAGESVVVVDANLRQPIVHTMYGLENSIGLASVLAGGASLDKALHVTDVANLTLLCAGPAPGDPSVLLSHEALKRLVGELRSRFAWVIVDTPPGLAFVDSVLTSVAVDAVLMVIAAGEVARGAEQRLLNDLESAGAGVLGAVVNKVQPQHADALYHYQKANPSATPPGAPPAEDASDGPLP
jgi:polysaccharide biosynthesis transport protein